MTRQISSCIILCMFFVFWLVPKCWNHLCFVNISPTVPSNWYINEKVSTSTTALKHKTLIFFFFFSIKVEIEFWLVPKCWNHPSFVVNTLSLSRWPTASHHNITGHNSMDQTKYPYTLYWWPRTPEWLDTQPSDLPSFVNISPTVVIDTSIERSLRVLQHGNLKMLFYFQKRSKLNFDLCRSAEIILASSMSVLH